MIQSIPLKKLTASPNNVRKSSDPAADAQLKADIAARVKAITSRPLITLRGEAGAHGSAGMK